ncbi:hypothetical protein A2738_03175 [Candidatus Nomurabacteria bacterium RIFCSPHIGHO2_01_FULL_42_15]|uniref:Uncharacterized protein n=1 Tax=Candidatus Nomurabacteria bacterium RIFCSPHIGHO2_01_FULL_42_15 TaxID=1801742 RepID=A0A1F6VE75_9BACT|nr:MAG: hypothetical protein A2738_03175 [Candidatus Nomurabacteria bacterium RIFCSPHIGHO2_01_FULL_42_15]OGI92942.1 MAG: hypothetical protein A3A99_00140 [Candidatus Nomurabacteria bacterium RIFCSPLOWO2_01_FULL_41_18]
MSTQLSHTDVGHGKEHVSRAKDPAIVSESQKSLRWIKGALRLIGITLVILFVVLWVKEKREKVKAKEAAAQAVAEYARAHPPAPIVVEYPTSGAGIATKAGLKAYLDPEKTSLRAKKQTRYVFVEDTSIYFDNNSGPDQKSRDEKQKEWENMPPGRYTVYPLGEEKVYFRWWQ